MHKVLFVDDDDELLALLSFLVRRNEFRSIVAANGSTALQLFREQQPDVVVLDIRLGADDGLEVLQSLRSVSDAPVIMLSSLESEADIERALELGADDYVTKPVPFRELVARLHAVLRRAYVARAVEPVDHWMRVGPLALNPHEHKALLDGLPLELTPTEFRLLQFLMDNTGRVVPLGVLLKRVWGYDDPTATDVVRAAIYRLRRKLVQTSSDRVLLLRTFPGLGIMLQHGAEQCKARRAEEFVDRFLRLDETHPIVVAA